MESTAECPAGLAALIAGATLPELLSGPHRSAHRPTPTPDDDEDEDEDEDRGSHGGNIDPDDDEEWSDEDDDDEEDPLWAGRCAAARRAALPIGLRKRVRD